MNKNDYIIRLERENEHREVENLIRESFWNVYRPGCQEHFVLHEYRTNPDFIPELDFVLEEEGRIIGHVMYSKACITGEDGRRLPAWTFGPISIHPDFQRKGYGLRLLQHALGKARERGIGVLCMEGNLDFYRQAGFVLASSLKILTMTEFTSQLICLFTISLHISCIVFLKCFTGLVCCS